MDGPAPNAGFLSGPPTEAPKTVLGPSFFAEFKKTEIAELREVLAKAIKFKRDDEITDALKKIVEAMTHGLNVQDLCETVVQVSHSRILAQKKMVYLYLNFHAKQVPAMAMMSVNSMVRDARDESPLIRGLALRWLCSLGVPDLVQHIVPVVQELLKDKSPYARRNATLGCGKLFHLVPDIFSDGVVVNDLYTLIRDRDSQVVINSLSSLDEILRSSGGMSINQKIILHLCSHLHEFNEWGLLYVLRLMQKYTPADEEELFAIMDLFDPKFIHMNSSVVLATMHLFLNYTQANPELYASVFERSKERLLCCLIAAPPEIEYATLKHILLVSKRAPTLFENEYKLFYLKPFSDPEYNKLVKVAILNHIATDETVLEIIEELSFYIVDDDIPVAQESIRCICRLAVRFPDTSSTYALGLLLSFLEFEQLLHVIETTADVLKDMLRRFPSHAPDVMPHLAKALDVVKGPEAVAAVISVLGEHGKFLDRAPYIIEDCIKGWEAAGAKVKNQLLVATLKLFFKRPFEMKPILSQLLGKAIEDFTNPDVHDKAIFYYRLLSASVETCAAVVNSSKLSIESNFSEDQDAAEVDRLFEEFNSLSVVFQQPSEQFLKFEEIDIDDKKPEPEEDN